jgi:hypothetical protein
LLLEQPVGKRDLAGDSMNALPSRMT